MCTGKSRVGDKEKDSTPRKTNFLTKFLMNFWFAISIPFTDLRKLVSRRDRDSDFVLSLRLEDGIVTVLLYLVIGVFAYHNLFEKFSITDALYFTVTCFSTVGYGDIS